MKILKWRIYRNSHIEKICQLLKGNIDDLAIAKSLLLPEKVEPEEEEFPKYRVLVKHQTVYLQKQKNKGEKWENKDQDSYYDEATKTRYVNAYKSRVETTLKPADVKEKIAAQFKEYTINF